MAKYPKVLRYDEDYSYLADPAKRRDHWDPIKYIPLDGTRVHTDGPTYLSLGGELRERFEHRKGYLNSPAPDDVLLHRLLLSADLHVGSSFRTFVQVANLQQAGRDGGSIETDENWFDLQQAFVDVSAALSENERATMRAGRQELLYGSGRFVAVREGPNARRSFDGVRAMYRGPNLDIDAFGVQPVVIRKGVFDDGADSGTTFWGVYGVSRFAKSANLDLYYFGIDYDQSRYVDGTAPERRHTLGTRAWGTTTWGNNETFDYNFEAVYQFGSFGEKTISAWATSLDAGWTLGWLPFSPRLGLKANIESGDRNRNDGTLGTLNPLFPNHAYFSEAVVGAPMNDMDVQPNVTFKLDEGVTLLVGYDAFWRYSKEDTVYTGGLQPIPGIAGKDGLYVGNLVTTHLRWKVDRHVELVFDYTHFDPSRTLKDANVQAIDFVMASAAYKF